MMHSDSATRSPSSFSFTRNTPCVEGCCGPILMISSSAPRIVAFWGSVGEMGPLLIFEFGRPGLLAAFYSQILANPGFVLLQDVVILTQRISLPLIRQQNPLQIRMAFEADAKHIERFPLQPIRHRPHTHHTPHTLV